MRLNDSSRFNYPIGRYQILFNNSVDNTFSDEEYLSTCKRSVLNK